MCVLFFYGKLITHLKSLFILICISSVLQCLYFIILNFNSLSLYFCCFFTIIYMCACACACVRACVRVCVYKIHAQWNITVLTLLLKKLQNTQHRYLKENHVAVLFCSSKWTLILSFSSNCESIRIFQATECLWLYVNGVVTRLLGWLRFALSHSALIVIYG